MSIASTYLVLEEVMKRRKRSPKTAQELENERIRKHIKEQTNKKTAKIVIQEKELPFCDIT